MNKKKISALSIAVVMLAVVLLINAVTLTLRITASRSVYTNEYSSLLREIQKEDYPALKENLIYNYVHEASPKQSTDEMEALAHCQEALQLYQAFLKSNDGTNAEIQYQIYSENASRITDSQLKDALQKLENQYLDD